MVRRKTYVKRKKAPATKKRMYTRKVTKGPRKTMSNTTTVVKVLALPDLNLTTLPNTPTFGHYGFNPVMLPEWGSYAALYDEYKFMKVKFTLEPKFTDNQLIVASDPSTTNLSVFNNRFYTYLDINDSNNPVSIQEFLNRKGTRYTKLNKVHTRNIYPKIPEDIDDSIVSTIVKPTNGFVSTATPVTDYLGLKYGAEEWFQSLGPCLQPLSYKVYATYTISFRTPK